jgi:hypothetical protein
LVGFYENQEKRFGFTGSPKIGRFEIQNFAKFIKKYVKNYIIYDEFCLKCSKRSIFTDKKTKFLYEYNIAFY